LARHNARPSHFEEDFMPAPALAPTIRGRFLWYELMTTDVEAAKAFYTAAIGWGSQPFPGVGEMPYTLWMRGEAPVGGMMALPEEARSAGAPPHWVPYVGTPDVNGTADRARTLGATVLVEPMDIPTVGRIAVLKDPQGAVFAIYAPASEPHAETDPAIGDVSWHELATTSNTADFKFYQNLFGWDNQQEMDMGPIGTYLMFGRGERMYGGVYNKPADMPAPPHWLLYMRVPDVNTSVPLLQRLGATLLNGPMEVPGGDLIAQFLDPQGAAFAIHSKKA
jgi:predicted enzyme related to lactoylglutathione lyase